MSTTSTPISRSGYNGTGSTIAKGTILALKSSGKYREVIVAASATAAVYGVAAQDIPTGTYGLVYIGGTMPTLASGALTVGGRVTSNGSGQAANAVTGNSVLGIAVEAGSAGVLTEIELQVGGPASV